MEKISVFFLLIVSVVFLGCTNKIGTLISLKGSNFLYKGIENPVSLLPKPKNNIELYCEDAEVTKKGQNNFSIKPNQLGILDIIVYNGKRKDTIQFRVKPIPLPEYFAIHSNGRRIQSDSIEAEVFSVARGLSLTLPYFDFFCTFPTIGYELVRIRPNGETKSFKMEGNALPSHLVKTAIKGDIFIFKDISVALCYEENIKLVRDIVIYIK